MTLKPVDNGSWQRCGQASPGYSTINPARGTSPTRAWAPRGRTVRMSDRLELARTGHGGPRRGASAVAVGEGNAGRCGR